MSNETTVKVKFRQLKSGTTVTTSYEESGDDVDAAETLKKAKELYDNAQAIAETETMKQL
mgnify:CR=1 FL=1